MHVSIRKRFRSTGDTNSQPKSLALRTDYVLVRFDLLCQFLPLAHGLHERTLLRPPCRSAGEVFTEETSGKRAHKRDYCHDRMHFDFLAADEDYSLTILSDACADPEASLHEELMTNLFPRSATVLSSINGLLRFQQRDSGTVAATPHDLVTPGPGTR